MRPTVYLSVVIPAYNEALRLPQTLKKIDYFLSNYNYSSELVVIDDCSRDATRQVVLTHPLATKVRVRVLTNRRNRGKGASIRRGMAAARGEFILFSDADMSTPIEDVLALFKGLECPADIAIGSRAVLGSRVLTPQPWYREFMGKIFNRFVQRVVLPGLHDTQCGFKLFKRSAARRVFRWASIPRFGFDAEVLYLARKARLAIVEIPVEWHNSLASTVSPWQDSFTMFMDLFRIRWRHRKTQV